MTKTETELVERRGLVSVAKKSETLFWPHPKVIADENPNESMEGQERRVPKEHALRFSNGEMDPSPKRGRGKPFSPFRRWWLGGLLVALSYYLISTPCGAFPLGGLVPFS